LAIAISCAVRASDGPKASDYRASPLLGARFLCIVEGPWDQDNTRSLRGDFSRSIDDQGLRRFIA
jgi:hypothetical protein